MTSFSSVQNHYEVLSLTVVSSKGEAHTLSDIKSAYHRALLAHHPDKSLPSSSTTPKYTIDEITQAYRILSDPTSRSSFDRQLRLHTNPTTFTKHCVAGISLTDVTSETVDLDDLTYDEHQRMWFRECRCGQSKGYVVTETHLEHRAADGETIVGCAGCSLWLRVLFAIVEDEG